MTTLDRVLAYFKIDPTGIATRARKSPLEIPDVDRDDLASLFGHLQFTTGAEIGTERGAYAEVLCRNNPGVKLFCVDAWAAYSGYREHVSQSKLDGFYESTLARLSPFGARLVRGYSVEKSVEFQNRSLDFVYIDANHTLKHVIDDITAWLPKVKKGGIISGHDYCRRGPGPYQVHVVEAVTAYTQAYHIDPWFVLGSKSAPPGEKRDRPRSWMWVVPE